MAIPVRSRTLILQYSSHATQCPSTGWLRASSLSKAPRVYHRTRFCLHVGHVDNSGTRPDTIPRDWWTRVVFIGRSLRQNEAQPKLPERAGSSLRLHRAVHDIQMPRAISNVATICKGTKRVAAAFCATSGVVCRYVRQRTDMSLCYAQNTRAGGVGTRKVNLIALRRDVPSSVDGRGSRAVAAWVNAAPHDTARVPCFRCDQRPIAASHYGAHAPRLAADSQSSAAADRWVQGDVKSVGRLGRYRCMARRHPKGVS